MTVQLTSLSPTGFLYAALVMRLGCRFTTIIGGLLAALGYALSAFAPNIYTLYVTYGVIAGNRVIQCATLYPPMM